MNIFAKVAIFGVAVPVLLFTVFVAIDAHDPRFTAQSWLLLLGAAIMFAAGLARVVFRRADVAPVGAPVGAGLVVFLLMAMHVGLAPWGYQVNAIGDDVGTNIPDAELVRGSTLGWLPCWMACHTNALYVVDKAQGWTTEALVSAVEAQMESNGWELDSKQARNADESRFGACQGDCVLTYEAGRWTAVVAVGSTQVETADSFTRTQIPVHLSIYTQ